MKKVFIIVVLILVFLSASSLISLFLSKYALRVTEYELKGNVKGDLRIVILSDLHSSVFGRDNERLVNKVKSCDSDLICLTGDTVNSDDSDFSVAADLTRRLSEIAPVYVSLGNQETSLSPELLDRFISVMTDAGAVVLEKEYRDLTINGTDVRIGGTSGYALALKFWQDTYNKKVIDSFEDESFSEQRFMLGFQNTDSYKILLLHRPEAATLFWADDGWYDVDLVLSGHTHGGQARFPFIGGLYAPEEGLFPKCEYGYFRKNDCDIIISAGLGGGKDMPRFNNIPEIVVINVYD